MSKFDAVAETIVYTLVQLTLDMLGFLLGMLLLLGGVMLICVLSVGVLTWALIASIFRWVSTTVEKKWNEALYRNKL